MPQLNFTVAEKKCIRCDACVKDCPLQIIERGNSVPGVPASSEESCIQCQHCLAVCPVGAISIFGKNPENSLPLVGDSKPSYPQMKTFLRGRRSVRQFRHENVPKKIIEELLADIAYAPTGCNDCDLIFTVIDDRKGLERLLERIIIAMETSKSPAVPEFLKESASAYRRDGTDVFFRGAPHLLIVSSGTKAHCSQEDPIIALSYFDLLAQSAGVGTTWCGMIKIIADAVPAVRPLLGLESDAYFYAMMFGLPNVKYARTVQRDGVADIRKIT